MEELELKISKMKSRPYDSLTLKQKEKYPTYIKILNIIEELTKKLKTI